MTTFTVTNLSDAGAGSLRQAVLDANAAAGADAIQFQSGLTGAITLTTGELTITDSVTVTGLGPASLTINGNNSSRIFNVNDGNSANKLDVVITGLTLTNGKASSGGAVFNRENLTVDNAVITGNTATSSGGGLYSSSNDVKFIIRNTTISGNTAADDGGGLYTQAVEIENCLITGNTATTGTGGGIYFDGNGTTLTPNGLKITNSTITGNKSGTQGGGIYIDNTKNGNVIIQGTTISGNIAGTTGGGIHFDSLDTSVVIENSTISGNTAKGGGGGVYLKAFTAASTGSLTINNTLIFDNTADSDNAGGGNGGGLSVKASPVTLEKTLVANNKVGTSGANPDVDGIITANNSLIENTTGGTITGAGNTTGTDPSTVTLSVAPAASPEGGSALVYTFTRTGSAANALTVNFTVGGNATFGAGQDYTQSGAASFDSTKGSITFAAGAATATLSLTPLSDSVAEASETIALSLSNGLYLKGTTGEVNSTIVQPTPLGKAPAAINFKKGKIGLTRKGTNGKDKLAGTNNNDLLIGNGGDDTLSGKGGKDRLSGGSGKDRLIGGSGDDQLVGGIGNDTLQGQLGNDVLTGGAGKDILTGGGGRDLFTFTRLSDAGDTITDFSGAQDLIDLRSLFKGAQFTGKTPFEKFFRYVKLEQVGASTLVSIDADGKGSGTVFTTLATLKNVSLSKVSSANFVIA